MRQDGGPDDADEPFRGLSPKDQALLARGLREMANRDTAIVVT